MGRVGRVCGLVLERIDCNLFGLCVGPTLFHMAWLAMLPGSVTFTMVMMIFYTATFNNVMGLNLKKIYGPDKKNHQLEFYKVIFFLQ